MKVYRSGNKVQGWGALLLFLFSSCGSIEYSGNATSGYSGQTLEGKYVLAGEKNFFSAYQPRNAAGDMQIVIFLIQAVMGWFLVRFCLKKVAGTVLSARLVGMIRMLDGGERDDKLIAVMLDSHFGGIGSLLELENRYRGATRILEIWFANYKGPGVTESKGIGDAEEASSVLRTVMDAYAKQGASTKQ